MRGLHALRRALLCRHQPHATVRLASDSSTTRPLADVDFDELDTNAPVPGRNSAVAAGLAAALERGIPAQLLEFQLSADEAVARFESYQRSQARGMHAHKLLAAGRHAKLLSAYFPFWSFTCTATVEYRGLLSFKDAGSGEVVWREMDDWVTLGQRLQLMPEQHPFMQVLPSPVAPKGFSNTLAPARPLLLQEALSLSAPAAAAALPSRRLLPDQRGQAEAQVPLSSWTTHGSPHAATPMRGQAAARSRASAHGKSSEKESGAVQGQDHEGGAGTAGAGMGLGGSQGRHSSSGVEGETSLHAPDMQLAVAWQLAYRGIVQHMTQQAAEHACKRSGAHQAKDLHVTCQFHARSASLLFLPVYLAYYQHGTRYKQGTASIIVPHLYYAAISGSHQGGLEAPTHISAAKVESAAAAAMLLPGLGPLLLPLLGGGDGPPLKLPWGPAEALAAALLVTAFASMWVRGRAQARLNDHSMAMMQAERDFYVEYDARETKTAATAAAAMAAASAAAGSQAHAAQGEQGTGPDWEQAAAAGAQAAGARAQGPGKGRPRVRPEPAGHASMPVQERGEAADEYMQWLWMNQDWRRWEGDEPWNWDEQQRWASAEEIARCTMQRKVARLSWLQRLMSDRDRREQELEQEVHRQRTGSRRASRRLTGASAGAAPPSFDGTGRRRDFLGYYRLMGLSTFEGEKLLAAGDITTETVKSAFKAQAKLLHPDSVMAAGGDVAQQRQASGDFQKLQMAYDVLRDPEKRRAYDQGQLVH
ncbi:hypothetical protein QJQ45_021238 [Haematococcus lacustris]|nr:hypothetical protein QJQ45_021238 [Haematococcus lacustris]